jgi:hypothetical protein
MSHFTALLDANVLHSYPLTSLLLELAEARLYRPAWSAEIHAEWQRSVQAARPGTDPATGLAGRQRPVWLARTVSAGCPADARTQSEAAGRSRSRGPARGR